MIFSNKTYDRIKWLVIIFLPFLTIILKGIGSEWQISYMDKIVNTINILTAALGSLIGASYIKYKNECITKGEAIIDEDGNPEFFIKDAHALEGKDKIELKVNPSHK